MSSLARRLSQVPVARRHAARTGGAPHVTARHAQSVRGNPDVALVLKLSLGLVEGGAPGAFAGPARKRMLVAILPPGFHANALAVGGPFLTQLHFASIRQHVAQRLKRGQRLSANDWPALHWLGRLHHGRGHVVAVAVLPDGDGMQPVGEASSMPGASSVAAQWLDFAAPQWPTLSVPLTHERRSGK